MQEALQEIEERIQKACASVGRAREEVTLIAVTKTVALPRIQEAYDLGIRHFGESRLQEALPKIQQLPGDITWHFIGKLQSNEVRRAAEVCDVLHTIETQSQLQELSKITTPRDILIEVNIAEEPQKAGVFPQDIPTFMQNLLKYDQANFRGLMTIGPANRNPEALRPFFQRLRELNEKVGGTWLSMGMSSDFDVSIQEGATHIRVGSALFGARN